MAIRLEMHGTRDICTCGNLVTGWAPAGLWLVRQSLSACCGLGAPVDIRHMSYVQLRTDTGMDHVFSPFLLLVS